MLLLPDSCPATEPPPESPLVLPRLTPQGEAQKLCHRIGNKLASVNVQECLDRNLAPSGGQSVEGAPILIREYPPAEGRTPQARVLLLGGIHGDEYSSVSIVFDWLQKLDRFHTGLFHWRIAPLVNPDGLLRSESQRTNARGVDLNRNFPTQDWDRDSEQYWVVRTDRDPRRYPGPSPLSEPESSWIHNEIMAFNPHVIIAVHAPFGLLDFDGPRAAPPQRLGHLYLDPMGTYPGSLGRFAGVEKGIPIVTIELTHAGIMPTETEIRNIWMDLVRWLSANIRDEGPRVMADSVPTPPAIPDANSKALSLAESASRDTAARPTPPPVRLQ
ncbi:MAG: murein peptide amidase A [Magnetococcales bacterium]|nr:murein peptide amidase A [Magnetococcales bacterium]